MRLAVLGDIHSNYTAMLEAIKYIEKSSIDGIIMLGDYVSDCAYPQDTMKLIYQLKDKYKCFFIKGNREDYFLDYEARGKVGWKKDSNTGNLLYTYNNLTRKDMEFFKILPFFDRVQIEGYPGISICHGSPYRSGELMFLGSDMARKALEDIEDDYLLCAHTHEQGVYEYNNKKLINPGALGVPFESKGYTQMAILNGFEDRWEEELILLKYDYEAEIERINSSELNEYARYFAKVTKISLRDSHNYLQDIVKEMERMRRADSVNGVLPERTEKYWEKAYPVISK